LCATARVWWRLASVAFVLLVAVGVWLVLVVAPVARGLRLGPVSDNFQEHAVRISRELLAP
jgi:H+/Cl- antiporter ClcA